MSNSLPSGAISRETSLVEAACGRCCAFSDAWSTNAPILGIPADPRTSAAPMPRGALDRSLDDRVRALLADPLQAACVVAMVAFDVLAQSVDRLAGRALERADRARTWGRAFRARAPAPRPRWRSFVVSIVPACCLTTKWSEPPTTSLSAVDFDLALGLEHVARAGQAALHDRAARSSCVRVWHASLIVPMSCGSIVCGWCCWAGGSSVTGGGSSIDRRVVVPRRAAASWRGRAATRAGPCDRPIGAGRGAEARVPEAPERAVEIDIGGQQRQRGLDRRLVVAYTASFFAPAS